MTYGRFIEVALVTYGYPPHTKRLPHCDDGHWGLQVETNSVVLSPGAEDFGMIFAEIGDEESIAVDLIELRRLLDSAEVTAIIGDIHAALRSDDEYAWQTCESLEADLRAALSPAALDE